MLVPARTAGFVRAYFVADGRIVAVRTLPPGDGTRLEIAAGLAKTPEPTQATDCFLEADRVDELFLLGTFLRRPPAEMRVARLDEDDILRSAAVLQAQAAGRARTPARAHAA